MPLRRAVVMSQAPGFSGTPSRGQCSSAATSASCTHSSARSKSPRLRTSAAVNRPASSRKTPATASLVTLRALVLDGGSNFHVAHRPGLRDPDRLIEIGDLDERVSAHLLLGFDEGPVEDLHRAINAPHRGGRAAHVEALAALDHSLFRELLPPLADRAVALHGLIRRPALTPGLIANEHQHVLRHQGSSYISTIGRTSTP